jgi:hypothetical protein
MFKIKEIVNPDENNSRIYNRIYPAFKDSYKGLEGVYDILNG